MPSHLGPKINLFLVIVIVALAAAISALLFLSFKRTQGRASEVSRAGLETEARNQSISDAGTQAFIGELLLEETGAMGQTSARYLSSFKSAGQPPTWDSARLVRAPGGELVDLTPFRGSDVFIPAGVEVSPAVEQDLRDSASLDPLVPDLLAGRVGSTRDTNFDAIAVHFDSVNRVTRYYPPASVRRLPSDYDVLADVASAGPEANPGRRTIWTPPYRDESRRAPVITARTPVYEGDVFRGVVSVDLSLTRLIAQVDAIHPGKTGFAFYIDRDGNVLQTAQFATIDEARQDAGDEFARTYAAMRSGSTGVDRIGLGGRDVFVAYAPLPEVGGSLALVSPVDEVTAQASAVSSSIESEGNRTLVVVLGMMAAFFVLALSGAVWLNRRLLLQPIGALVSGTRAVAAGNLDVEIPVQSSDELGMLADSFNLMTSELQQSRGRLEKQQERVAASEAELRALFAAMTDDVLVLDRDGRYLRTAPTNADVAYWPREEIVGKTLHEIVPRDLADRLLPPVQQAIDSGETQQVEYALELPGREMWFSASISPLPNGTALVVSRDISDRVQAAQLLEQRVEERTRELSTLLEVSRTVSSTLDLRRLLGLVLDQLQDVTGYIGASILIREEGDLVILDSRGPAARGAGVIGMRFPLDRVPDMWALVGSGQNVRVDDVRDDSDGARTYRMAVGDLADAPGFSYVRSFMVVPLGWHDRVIGMLTLSHDVPGHYTDQHSDVARGVATQAAVAIENARLFETTRDRTRELSTLLDVSRNVASTLELQPMLNVILEQVKSVTPYDRAGFFIVEGNELVVRAVASGTDEPASEFEGQLGTRYDTRRAVLWDVVSHGECAVIPDVRAEERMAIAYRRAVGPLIDTTFRDIRGWMGVPLASKNGVVGMLALSRHAAGPWDDREAQLVMAIASQAAGAIENARLFEQTRERTRELASLLEVSRNLASMLEVEPLLNVILEQVKSVADYDMAGFLIVEGDELVVRATASSSPEPDTLREGQLGLRLPAGRGRLWHAVREGHCVIIDDVRADDPMASAYRAVVGPVLETTFRDIRSWMGVPLTSKDGVVGVLALSHVRPRAYDERQCQLVSVIANQAATAIENARLFEQTQQRTRELGALLQVSRAVASTLELRPLVLVIFEQLRSVIDYNAVTLVTFEDDTVTALDVSRPDIEPDRRRFRAGWKTPMSQGRKIWDQLLAGEHVIIEDVRGEGELAREYRESLVGGDVDQIYGYVQAWLAVPMRLKDRVIGALIVSHTRSGYFTEDMARLASAVGDQAAVAIDNARLFEQAEDRTRELSALLDVSQAVASTLELEPLVNEIFEQLGHIVDYTGASLLMLEDDALVSRYGGRGSVELVESLRLDLADIPLIWDSMQRQEPVIIRDIHGDEIVARELHRATGEEMMRTHLAPRHAWIGVPLALQDRVIGMLAVAHTKTGYFTDHTAELVAAVGHQAAIAIENARLYEQAEDRTREMSALLEISSSVASTIQLGPLVDVVLQQMRKIIDYDRASVLTVESDSLVVLDTGGQPAVAPAGRQALAFPIARFPNLWPLLQRGEVLIIDDLYADSPYATELRETVGDELLTTVFPHVQSFMGVPLLLHDRAIGMIALSGRTTSHFRGQHVENLALAVASQAAVAIENARLYQQAQELAAVEERQRLARELHDSVSQALYGIALGARTARTQLDRDPARAVEPVEYVLSLAEAGLAEMRALIFELRPESLELEGLVAGLEKQAAALRARHHVDVTADLCPEPDVSLRVKEAISRIAQEALHNTVKHARASHVDLSLSYDNGEIIIEIRDDGAGFDPGGEFPGHLGLRSMRERAAKFGGTLRIDSEPGAGTRIVASVRVENPPEPR